MPQVESKPRNQVRWGMRALVTAGLAVVLSSLAIPA